MAQARLIQGSWEELSAHADEFKSRTDLMLIIPGDEQTVSSTLQSGVSLAEALKGRTGLVSFDPADLSEDTGRKFSELLRRKLDEEAL